MKRNVVPLLICLLPAVALAQTVYESQDKEGPVFSDTPRPDAQPVDLPPANVIDSPTPAQQQPVSQPASPGYTAVTILSPQDQGTVHSNTGEFQVSLALTPALQGDNTIQHISRRDNVAHVALLAAVRHHVRRMAERSQGECSA